MSSCWLTSNNSPILYMSPQGQVGINTITPQYPLDVLGSANVSSMLQVGGLSNLGNTFLNGSLLFNDIATAKWQMNTLGYKLNFNNDISGTLVNKMVLTNAGQLGIGTSLPTETIHAIGNIKGSGNLILEGGHHVSTGATVLDSGNGQFNWRHIVGSNSASYTELAVLADSNLSVYGSVTTPLINITSAIDLGSSIVGRDSSAGHIGYNYISSNTLDIIGAGTAVNSRNIKLWDNVTIPGNITIAGNILNSQQSIINNLSMSTSNFVYPQIASLTNQVASYSTYINANPRVCKSMTSTGPTPINTVIKWANNTQSGNHFFLIVDLTQQYSSDTMFGIKNTSLCLNMSNCSIADQRSAQVFGNSAVFTTMNCAITASNPALQTLTLTSTTSWSPSGTVNQQMAVSVICSPSESGLITIS